MEKMLVKKDLRRMEFGQKGELRKMEIRKVNRQKEGKEKRRRMEGSFGLSTATRALIIVVSVIIVCIVCSLALYM